MKHRLNCLAISHLIGHQNQRKYRSQDGNTRPRNDDGAPTKEEDVTVLPKTGGGESSWQRYVDTEKEKKGF